MINVQYNQQLDWARVVRCHNCKCFTICNYTLMIDPGATVANDPGPNVLSILRTDDMSKYGEYQ